jgi:transposase
VNALRAHLGHVGRLTAVVRDEGEARLPDLARQVLQVLAAQIEQLEAAVAAIEKQLMAWHKSTPVSQRLATMLSFTGCDPSETCTAENFCGTHLPHCLLFSPDILFLDGLN